MASIVEELEKRKQDQESALEATKKAIAIAKAQAQEAGSHHGPTLAIVNTYSQHWTQMQRAELRDALDLGTTKKSAKGGKKAAGKSKGPADPFYQLDTGETCAEKTGKFKKDWAGALNAAIAKAGGKRENLPRYPNPNAPEAAAQPAST